MRNSNGRFVKGFSGNPSGIKRDEAPTSLVVTKPIMPARQNLDGWVSALTGIGSATRDKRESHSFQIKQLSYHDAIEIWRGDDIAARAIDTVPADCFRQGYEIMISDEGSYDDLKEEIEDRLLELKVDEIVERAYKYERAFGGGAILLGVDDGCALDEPLVVSRVKSLDYLTLLEPIEIYPDSYYQDPASPKYGEPEFYRLQAFTVAGAGTVIGVTDRRAPPPSTHLIHESRLVVFGGIRVSRYQRNTSLMGPLWGDSILIRLIDVLRDFNVAWSAAGIIVTDFAQTVISMENLMGLVAKDEAKFRARMQALDLSRSVARAVAIDSKETLKRESTNVQGLPELLDRLSSRVAAAVDLPLSMLMGNTQKSMSADAESDVQWYHDRVRAVQRRRLRPVIRFMASMIMQTIRKKKVPKKWDIKFHDLKVLTDAEMAQARLTQARSDSMYVKMGALSSDEIRRSRFVGEYSFETQVEEHKKAPGFMAPLPHGVMPGPGGMPAPAAAGGAKSAGPNVHGVRSYARKNPDGPRNPGGASAKEGGDKAPENKRDDVGSMAAIPGALGARKIIHRQFAGLHVAIENPRGTTRHWVDTDGTPGQTEMKYDYGYIIGAQGADGDDVDIYLGPNEAAQNAYIVHQNKKPEFYLYDEDKVMLGFDSAEEARAAYVGQYDDERYFGGMSVMPMDQFTTTFGLLHTLSNDAARADASPGDNAPRLDFVVQEGSKWVVKSEKGKSLGSYETKGEAVQRLRQVEYFKAHPDEANGEPNEDGGWSEQEIGYEVDKPAAKEPTAAPLVNESPKSGSNPDDR